MEKKKNPRYDLEKWRGVFLNIGLIMSISVVIVAFEWKTEKELVDIPTLDPFNEALMDVPVTIFAPPPPPKPKVILPKIKVVDDDVEVDEIDTPIDVEINENDIIVDVPIEVDEPEEIEETFVVVEEAPEPLGGMNSFYKFVSKNLKYPRMAKKSGIEGRVYVQFVVDKDGSITEIKTVKGIGGGCDEEAVRVFQKAAKWNPGKQRGRPVRVRMIIPIYFQLN